MRLVFSPQPDGSMLIWGRYKSEEYSYSARHFVLPGNSFGGLTWDELSALAWIETDDDGAIVHKEPRGESMQLDQNAARPSFLRDVP